MAAAYLCVSIDCECDKGPAWRSRSPLSFDGISDGIVCSLQPMFRRFHAKPTYLLSPEVMRDAESVELLRALEGSHELGSHLHGEYAEPGAFLPEVTTAFQRDYAADVERAKLVYLTDLFAGAFGRRPTSFRAGRFGIGPNSIPILEELGYRIESSVTPHLDWSDKGSPGLSFLGSPTQPYHPHPSAPERTGSAQIWEVPVTIRPRQIGRLPVVGRFVEPRWLRPTRGTARGLVSVAREEIDEAQRNNPRRPVVLNAMFHNVEVLAGTSPYASTESEAQGILDRLAALLEFAQSESIPTIGLSDVPEVLAHAPVLDEVERRA